MSVHRVDNANFTIENPRFSPSDFGSRTLGNFLGPFVAPGTALVVNFSSAITGGSISFGDYNVDDDGMVTLTAFSGLDGGGSSLGTSSVAYTADLDIDNRFSWGGNAAIRTLTVNAAGIQSLTILAGGPFPNTLFFDN